MYMDPLNTGISYRDYGKKPGYRAGTNGEICQEKPAGPDARQQFGGGGILVFGRGKGARTGAWSALS